ncbi:hypothetical protein EDB19DRAFT_1767877 [Suillus lakei]|nr:hypothetical protein EDB19DRAFT_1767877 [Suillus lakei]
MTSYVPSPFHHHHPCTLWGCCCWSVEGVVLRGKTHRYLCCTIHVLNTQPDFYPNLTSTNPTLLSHHRSRGRFQHSHVTDIPARPARVRAKTSLTADKNRVHEVGQGKNEGSRVQWQYLLCRWLSERHSMGTTEFKTWLGSLVFGLFRKNPKISLRSLQAVGLRFEKLQSCDSKLHSLGSYIGLVGYSFGCCSCSMLISAASKIGVAASSLVGTLDILNI